MECKGVKAILAIAAILFLLVGQSSLSKRSKCYDECYPKCRSQDNPVWLCKYKCTLDCLIPISAAKVDSGCSLACAKSSCGQHDIRPEGIDMAACLSQCSKSCTKLTGEHQDLLRVLRNATMNDKTVILTALNEAWAKPNSVLDLFLESFHIGEQTEQLLNHLVIIAMDPKAFERCKSVHAHCYFLTTEAVDFTAEKRHSSQDYLRMKWRRLEFLRVILELGYNFLFTDMDVMWFRNPFSHFSSNADITFSTDGFNGNPSDVNNWPNNGFVYVRSCDQTIEFYKYWCFARSLYPGLSEQTVLNKIKYDNVARINQRIRFLDTAYFGGFCQPSKDFNKVCTMHANCCIDIDTKLHDLRILLADWKNYTSRTAEERKLGGFSWRIPDKCNMESLQRSTPEY
ncbi:uncharacterized protein At4g15970-like [Phoenix dactylifera]|uniref:Uncharacterized protein At4g15970-like n=1 Tax=Phoenix dactylifera TaxID=42345 RepID=A0A8B8ZJG1_PHODC|nr:uncharacterized protein At4g15970-like [Phoenix dactylifera]